MNTEAMNLRSADCGDRRNVAGDPLEEFLTSTGRVLFIASPVYDYLSDGVYHGLIQLLGRDRVIDCPRQDRYHISEGIGPDTKYPMLNFVDENRSSSISADSIDVRSFDVIVIGRLHSAMFPLLRRALRSADRNRIAFLDGMDDPYVRGWMRRRVGAYFKRELLRPSLASWLYAGSKLRLGLGQNLQFVKEWASSPLSNQGVRHAMCAPMLSRRNVQPLPFGLVDIGYSPPVVEKQYDVAFIGTLTSTSRQRVLTALEVWNRARNLRLLVKVTNRMSWREYLDTLSRTRVCINVRGAGIDTYRYWEIPYTGSMLLSERLLIEIPNNFEDGKQAFFFNSNDLDDLKRNLDRIFDDEDLISRVAKAGREHVLRHHTTESRAKTVLQSLRAEDRMKHEARSRE